MPPTMNDVEEIPDRSPSRNVPAPAGNGLFPRRAITIRLKT